MNKYVVYTALFGDYDDLIEPKNIDYKCDFICFTNQENITSDKWKIIYVKDVNDTVLKNREYKFLPHLFLSQYDASVYVDSNIKIIQDPVTLIEKYIEISPVSVPKHFSRNCIYKEVEQCVLEKKITEENGRDMLNLLSAHSFPKEYGLGENNIIIRKHNHKDVIRLMNYWWEYFNQGAKRDQLTLFFLSWKHGVPIQLMDETSRNKNNYFRYHLHKNEKKLPLMKRSYLFMKANRQRVYFY
ncbi:glycosyltransferase domain-containing protein, partial [Klebsiella pneumoniae]|nr:DUF616 domain-containing protein [Klebsiella pneumoniae]HBX9369320.1 DUF616 domain-containing protein [Klebsiella pneumoniae]